MKLFLKLCGFFVFALLCRSDLGAQAPAGSMTRITGTLQDASQKAPVSYATVTLLRGDGSVAGGSLTGEEGRFRIEIREEGGFSLRISALGYEEKLVPVRAAGDPVALGIISLQVSSQTLDQVEIVGEKRAVELSVDKKTFNVENNLTTSGGSAADVLQQVPSVSIDNDGNPSLRGRSNVTLLIDGKPATLLGTDAASALQSLPASGIESVEVITNPSAKYDAQGMGGIINIVTKKDRKAGANGNASLGIGTRGKYNGSVNLNYRNNRWNYFFNSSFRSNRNQNYALTERTNRFYGRDGIYNDSFYRTDEDQQRIFGGWFTTGGATFNMNERNTFTLTENFNYRAFGNNGLAAYGRYGERDGLPALMQERKTEMMMRSASLSSSLDYRHQFLRPNRSLTANLNYVHTWSNRRQEYQTRMYDGSGLPVSGPVIQQSPGTGTNSSWNAQADFTTPLLSETDRLDAGVKAQLFSFSSVNTPTIAYPGMPAVTDSILLSNYDYSQDIYAAYTSYSGSLGKFGYQGGLRLEYSEYQGRTDAYIGDRFSNSFLNLFPSAFVSYQLAPMQSVYLNYTKRVNRPGFWQLMPNINLSEPQDTSVGNPGLIPEFIHNTELNYQIKSNRGHNLIFSTYYQYTQNLIERYLVFYEDGTSFRQPRNLNEGVTYGLELIGRAQVNRDLDATLNLNFFHNEIRGAQIDPALNNSGFSWFGKVNINQKLPRNFALQLNGNYEAPKIAAQSDVQEVWWIDLAVRKTLFGNRATFTANLSDIFNTRRHINIFDLQSYYQRGLRDRETRILNLTFSWRFGRQESRSVNGRRSGTSPEGPKERNNLRQGDDDSGF